jgi:hypothetical protein
VMSGVALRSMTQGRSEMRSNKFRPVSDHLEFKCIPNRHFCQYPFSFLTELYNLHRAIG